MTEQQIIEWAREAGLDADWIEDCKTDAIALKRFAALVAAHAKAEERERCAKVCDTYGKGYGVPMVLMCADHIRALKD